MKRVIFSLLWINNKNWCQFQKASSSFFSPIKLELKFCTVCLFTHRSYNFPFEWTLSVMLKYFSMPNESFLGGPFSNQVRTYRPFVSKQICCLPKENKLFQLNFHVAINCKLIKCKHCQFFSQIQSFFWCQARFDCKPPIYNENHYPVVRISAESSSRSFFSLGGAPE